jgi:hypothetical protein
LKNMKKCITCDVKIDGEPISKFDVFFCSEKCLKEYEDKLKEMEKVVDWDKCC